jgi:hypothetical protein
MTTTFQTNTSRESLRVAEFSTSIDFVPYIREQTISFYATGLRPGARVYAYFDGIYVTNRIIPATIQNLQTITPTRSSIETNLIPNGQTLAQVEQANTFLTVAQDGSLAGIFHLPTTTFFTGDREFVLADVSNFNSLDTASTYAKRIFYAYNFNPQTTPTPAAEPPPVVNPVTPPIVFEPREPFFWDPVAQTFIIPRQDASQAEGVYCTSVDLFFATKDPQRGVTVQITETDNGYPARTVLPGSVCWKHPDNVQTSSTGVTATKFTFPQPVYLKTDTEYAIVVIPDGNNPNYQIFTAAGGGNDLATGTTVRQDWGFGVLFRSTNNRAWTAIQNEDLKMTLRVANFTSLSGNVELQNKNYEFFTVNAVSQNFLQGEKVWQITTNNTFANTFLTGNLIANTQSSNVTGTGTLFNNQFAQGQYVVIPNHNNYVSATKFDLVKVISVTNATHMVVERAPTVNVTAGQVQSPVVGTCDFFDRQSQKLTLTDSNAANTTFLFKANNTVVGLTSNATAVIQSIDNKIVSYHQALINKMTPPSTSLAVQHAFTANVGGNLVLQNYEQVKLNDNNYLPNYEAIVASRSNEITSFGSNKSFRANVTLSSLNSVTSPIVNTLQLSSLQYKHLISNTNTNEHTTSGSANTKHISTKIVLADGQDAEDIKVFLTAYKPANTEVEVYVKAISAFDSESFDSKAWTKLVQNTDASVISSTLNPNDFREYEYSFPLKPQSTVVAGVASCSNTSTTVTGVGTNFTADLTTSDAIILIDPNDSSIFDIKRITGITNGTQLTISSNCAFTSSGALIEKMNVPTSVFKNVNNDKIIRYFGVSGGVYDTYKTFAIKIVLLADTTNRVPAIDDIRVVALSV